MAIDFPELYAVAKAKAIQLSATNFDSFTLKTTNNDGSQTWTVKWINSSNTYTYDIKFPAGVNANVGTYDSKTSLETAYPTGITQNQFAMVNDGTNLYLASYKNNAWNYQVLNNKVVFRKTATAIEYKFADEDDSKYKEFVKLVDIKGDKIKHQWVNSTQLQLENPDGTFDTPVELKGSKGDINVPKYIDGTKITWDDGKGGLTEPIELRGKTGDSLPSIADTFVGAYSTNNDVRFQLKKNGSNDVYEVEWDNALPSIASHVNFGEYMGSFDINNLPQSILKGQFWRSDSPFNYNNKYYPSGSLIVANKDKSSLIEKVDFDFYANRGSSVSVKIAEEIFNITMDTTQLTLKDFDNTTDSALIMVSGGTKAGAIVLNEGVDFNYTSNNVINVTSTKFINGDSICVKKFKNTKVLPLRDWAKDNNYFTNDLVRSPITNGIYLALKDVPNSQTDPSLSADGSWTNISQVSRIQTFTLNAMYGVDDVVINPVDGFVYRCIKDTTKADKTPDKDSTTWTSLAKVGRSAYEEYLNSTSDLPKKNVEEWLASLKGRGMVFKGEYLPTNRYYTNEYVRMNSRLYLCVTEDPLGITNVPPDSGDVRWSILFTGAIDPTNLIRNDINNNDSYTWGTIKLTNELALKSDKDSVIMKGNTTPYTPQSDNDTCTYGNVKQLINTDLNLDMIGDGVQYKKSEQNYTQAEKDKLANIQASNKGIAYSKEDLQARYPDGDPKLKSGDTIVVLGNGLNHIFYYTDKWNDSGSQSAGTGLAEAVYDPRGIKKDK